tara:strand:- start:80 stop:430 length:351 start_codon:yes stop_codon:yes gene_type:complete
VSKYLHNIRRRDKKYLTSPLQFNSKEKDDFVSAVFLGFKVCFSLLAIISLVKIGHSSKVRLTRLREIKDSYSYEKSRFYNLSRRFDDLISFDGEQRFMKDQDQMISKDIIRVIWRR